MPDQIQCPHCGQTYQLTSEQVPQYAGRTITCTQCQKPFTVPGERRAAPAPAPVAASAATPVVPTMPTPVTPQPPAYPGSPSHVNYAGPQTYGRQEPNSFAVASLVSGCVGFIIPVIPMILAIVFGIIALKKTRDPRVGGKGLAIAGICIGCFSFVLSACAISILLPSLGRARETANRVKCASNMRQIGQALLLYANDNRGAYPQQLNTLLTTEDITSEVFVCPTSTDSPAMPGGTAQQQGAALNSPGHLSYVYIPGLNNQASPDTVVLYENPGNHNGVDGMNFLWGDGHVSWEGAKYAKFIVNEVTTGHNPPRQYTGQ